MGDYDAILTVLKSKGLIEDKHINTTDRLINVVVSRLNAILDQDPDAMRDLVEKRIPVAPATYDEDVVVVIHKNNDGYFIGMLEVINSILGPIPEGPKEGQQFIIALYDCSGALRKFARNDLDDIFLGGVTVKFTI
jgi:hypothetical protein